jgi:predicted transcriptional regulator of viral defense system
MAKRDRILALASEYGVIQAKDALRNGVSGRYLDNLVEQGTLQKEAKGVYSSKRVAHTEDHNLVVVSTYASRSVVCLLSALQFHGIGTQLPNNVWIALPSDAKIPIGINIEIQAVRMNPEALSSGVETHVLEGVPVKIFNVAKTVTDCFKYASSVGLDVCLEALKDVLKHKRSTIDELYYYAKINRQWNNIRPYLEALQ